MPTVTELVIVSESLNDLFSFIIRVLAVLEQAEGTIVIPPKANRLRARSSDKHLYQARHLIENFFAKLKQYRALATRYDKRAVSFRGAIYLAASVILLN